MSDALAILRKFAVIGLLAVIGIVAADQSWAACTQSYLKGRYQFYINWNDPDGGGWIYCPVKFQADGDVTSGTDCFELNESGKEGRATIKGGSVTVANSCRLSGKIRATGCEKSYSNVWLTISNAYISKDRNTIMGAGEDCFGAPFQFNAVRR